MTSLLLSFVTLEKSPEACVFSGYFKAALTEGTGRLWLQQAAIEATLYYYSWSERIIPLHSVSKNKKKLFSKRIKEFLCFVVFFPHEYRQLQKTKTLQLPIIELFCEQKHKSGYTSRSPATYSNSRDILSRKSENDQGYKKNSLLWTYTVQFQTLLQASLKKSGELLSTLTCVLLFLLLWQLWD